MARSKNRDREESFERTFEGAELLDGLLEIAGSELTTADVLEAMKEAHVAGDPSNEVIPTLLPEHPRFPDPSYARRLFANLLGLWDLVVGGEEVDLTVKGPREPRVKPPKPPRPAPFEGEPDEEFVEAAWRYLDGEPRERQRAFDAFENRQDAIVQWLDASGVSDEGYGVARHLLFELFAMLELGWTPGLRALRPAELEAQPGELPAALLEYVDEALFEAEQDEEAPLPSTETARVRELVTQGLGALWRARKPA